MATSEAVITRMDVKDVRFPTSLEAHGSDAMHTDPDYSCAYVIIHTDANDSLAGHGLTFTIGRGTEIVVLACKTLSRLVIGQKLSDVYSDFGRYWRKLTSESQLRWLGPEKGVMHLATAAVLNALWDLYAKLENKPLWKLLVDMSPQELVSCIDFRYITDALTKEDALQMLQENLSTKQTRECELLNTGYPAYTTSVAWLGYSDETLSKLCEKALKEGWSKFKVKVGADLADDKRRCALIRKHIGWERKMMMDANQRWDVNEAIDYMKELAEYKPWWIEEPTSPDDILGHAAIAQALSPLDIGVATGEHAQNRVIFKQLLQAKAVKFCQIDSCRLGSVNENLAVIMMAKKFGVPVCPHAGGVGLCELVQHISLFDYICVSASLENRVIEYVDHLHEHFKYPVCIKNACYMPPQNAGYSTEMIAKSISDYEYPKGSAWQQLIMEGKFQTP
ncbi:mitochondrial enolase superfamily member 1-like [Saccoglossus kowalevskii]|uniref:L-fuconate dehydratase n=1 Tax=Saccoglossus kowalevskii TaxID=10224 RepID=A0ABM0GN25_SACKO|nr:PREDICTED: mitochondrial enolase superfamily member 1-like [Saccoglossus kowalevskii]